MAIVARGFPGLTFATMPWSATDSTKRIPAKEAGSLARCWQSFNLSDTTKVTPAIKDEVRRHGFPATLRADAYFFLSGASQLQLEQPANTYGALAASTSNLSDEAIFSVEDDVRNARTVFKDTRLFATAKGAEVLSRIIFAYIQRNPACGYFKGLAHMAALLLTVFGRDREEHAFWTLVALLERRFFQSCSGQAVMGARVEVQVLQSLLEQRHTSVAASLTKLGGDALEHLCFPWFSTGFTRTLPHEVVLRVWDSVVLEGSKVCLRVAMALVKIFASSIQSCTNIEVLCRVMEGRLSRYSDIDALLGVAFKGLGSLSGSVVEAARLRALAVVQQSRSAQPAPLAAAARPLGSTFGSTNSLASTSSGRGVSKHASPWPSPKSSGTLLAASS